MYHHHGHHCTILQTLVDNVKRQKAAKGGAPVAPDAPTEEITPEPGCVRGGRGQDARGRAQGARGKAACLLGLAAGTWRAAVDGALVALLAPLVWGTMWVSDHGMWLTVQRSP